MIRELLKDKPAKERAKIKAKEIAKLNHKGKFLRGDLEIEVIDLKAIEGGIEVFARAWKNGKQLGFGDGSVDIERFRIFNPPMVVKDGTKKLETVSFGGKTKEIEVENYKEDAIEAIRQNLIHTISLVGKEGSSIVPGKIGNTTSTFYPDASVESTSVDGYIHMFEEATWTAARDAATGELVGDDTEGEWLFADKDGSVFTVGRHFYLFDTSALGDTDTIDSATFSAYQSDAGSGDPNVGLIQTSPASNTALATSDFDAMTVNSPTEGATRVAATSATNLSYRDFTLNASGLSWISKTGITKLGLRLDYDIDNTTPTARRYTRFKFADAVGTTEDPKLVVVHTSPATFIPRIMMS